MTSTIYVKMMTNPGVMFVSLTLCLGYCNLAEEDFGDEEVKYIREGFEKRVRKQFSLLYIV